MNAALLLANLAQQGVQLSVQQDKLSIRSPKGVLTPELQAELTAHKAELLTLLRQREEAANSTCPSVSGLGLQTIGRLIGGFANATSTEFKPPVIDPTAMAQQLSVTFRPLPENYDNPAVVAFRQELEAKLQACGVTILPWEAATREWEYDLNIPLARLSDASLQINKPMKVRTVKAGVSAVVDVEQSPSAQEKFATCIAETFYQLYSRYVLKGRKLSITAIVKLVAWAEAKSMRYIEDPTNTQAITLTAINAGLIDPQLPYREKIKIGLNTLIKTFSEIVIGVSDDKLSILNMNLSDSVFARGQLDHFILNSLIPKIYVPIAPIPMSRFAIDRYDPQHSPYAAKLVQLGQALAATELLPSGSKLTQVIKRKSHRDVVNSLMDGRNGVSYGFVAYAEPPQYEGDVSISAADWEALQPIPGFSSRDLRENDQGRWYIRTQLQGQEAFKQVPDIWIVSSRSGSNKTSLDLEQDILRIGLKRGMVLQVPEGLDPKLVDIRPSYDLYVMLAIALAASLYTPKLIENGAAMVHFHGYPSADWFGAHEYCAGVSNPSVPCGTYESGVFNFLGIYNLANQYGDEIALASLIEPDHGTNIVAPNLEYLIERLQAGCATGAIELGGKNFGSLKHL